MALVTARSVGDDDPDMALLVWALAGAGIPATVCIWDEPSVAWDGFDLVVLRSVWDYVPRHGEFLGWLEDVGGRVPVENAPGLVAWNTDKRYLAELAAGGVPIIPTRFLVAPEEVDGEELGALAGNGHLVVKPAVSAGARDTVRHTGPGPAAAQARSLLAAGRPVLVQRYVDSVDTRGERSCVFFGGAYSHGFAKGRLLRPGEVPPDQEARHGAVGPAVPDEDERAVAASALAAVPGKPLYARVDLVRLEDGTPAVIEVELAEPALFCGTAPGSADRFAAAVADRLGRT